MSSLWSFLFGWKHQNNKFYNRQFIQKIRYRHWHVNVERFFRRIVYVVLGINMRIQNNIPITSWIRLKTNFCAVSRITVSGNHLNDLSFRNKNHIRIRDDYFTRDWTILYEFYSRNRTAYFVRGFNREENFNFDDVAFQLSR